MFPKPSGIMSATSMLVNDTFCFGLKVLLRNERQCLTTLFEMNILARYGGDGDPGGGEQVWTLFLANSATAMIEILI
jgi:hypothetical protein